jgi:3-hydroxyisobutyrate dehydrogenase
MNKLKLGWIGLGNMGNPIVKNLLKAGYPVTVYNRTKGRDTEVVDAGASVAESPQQLAEGCDVIMIMVSDDNAVKQIFNEDNGLLKVSLTGKLIIDLSTVSPDTSHELAAICKKQGADFVDAPVSGSVKPAQDATLIIMTGGEDAAVEKAKPILDVIGKLTLHLGNAGAGSSAKLAINYFLGVTLQGFAETILFARKAGIKQEDMFTIINEGAVGSGITKLKSQNVANNNYSAAFPLKHLAKDLKLAKDQGLDTPLLAPLLNSYQEALSAGYGDEDVIAILKYLDKN